MLSFTSKQYNTAQPLTDTLSWSGDADLTGCTVYWCYWLAGESPATAVCREATVVDAEAMEVSYTPVLGDVLNPAVYEAEWRVVFPTGEEQSVPDDGDILWTVLPAPHIGPLRGVLQNGLDSVILSGVGLTA